MSFAYVPLAATDAALDPALFAHRDMMVAERLALPLSL